MKVLVGLVLYSCAVSALGQFPIPSFREPSSLTTPEEQLYANLAVKERPSSFCDRTDDGFAKVFEDDFDGEVLNEDYWTPITDESREYYHFACGRQALCRRENMYLKDGHLVLVSTREDDNSGPEPVTKWYSAGVNSRTKKYYSTKSQIVRVCVRGIPPGKEATTVPGGAEGIFPAYWLMAEDSFNCNPQHGEMDIFESIRGDPVAYTTYHVTKPGHGCEFDKDKNSTAHLQSFSASVNLPGKLSLTVFAMLLSFGSNVEQQAC